MQSIQDVKDAMDGTGKSLENGMISYKEEDEDGGEFNRTFGDADGNLGVHMQKSKEMSERQNPNKFPNTENICVLSPLSSFRIRWDVATLLMLTYVALVTPYELGFLGEEWQSQKDSLFWGLFTVNRCVDIFFIMDFALHFMTGFYEEYRGVWIVHHTGIAWGYLKGWMFIDFVSCVPYDMIAMGAESGAGSVSKLKVLRILRLLRLTKLLRLLRASRVMRRLSNSILFISFRMQTYISALLQVVFLAHWGGCAFHLIGMMEYEDGRQNWIEAEQRGDDSFLSQYITSIHWSIATLKANEFVSTTLGERFLGLCLMIIGSALTANVISSVVNTQISLDQCNNEYKRTMDNLLSLIQERHIPPSISKMLRQYFTRCRSLHSQHYQQETLMRMSPSLRGMVALHCNTGWILKVHYLRSEPSESTNFVTDVSLHLRSTAFPAGENLVNFGEPNSRMYILQHGVACSSRGHITTNGGYFGEDMVTNLVSNPVQRAYTVMSLSFCEVYYLSATNLQAILASSRYPLTRKLSRLSAFKLLFRMRFKTFIAETAREFALLRRQSTFNGRQVCVFRSAVFIRTIAAVSYSLLNHSPSSLCADQALPLLWQGQGHRVRQVGADAAAEARLRSMAGR
jgi:CRP-like cAMP-binding protein